MYYRSGRRLVYYKKGAKQWGNPIITGIDKEEAALTSVLYPNPAANHLNIVFTGDLNNANIEITDLTGLSLLKSKLLSLETQLDVSNLQNGIYLCKTTMNNKVVTTGKLVIE